MARIRTIKPEFWEDEKVGKLPVACRLFFIGCWNFADDFGCIKGNAALLKSQIFPYDENLRVAEVKKWIDALVNARMLIPIIHAEESYYYIRTFRSHQILDARYSKSYLGKEIANDVIEKALKNYNENTASTRRDPDVDTSEEKEMPEEKESNHPPFIPPSGEKEKSDYEKFEDWVKEHTPTVAKISRQITEEEFYKLKGKYNSEQIVEVLEQMENYKGVQKKYTWLYRTFLNWAEKRYGK